jgi:hypothetical protein
MPRVDLAVATNFEIIIDVKTLQKKNKKIKKKLNYRDGCNSIILKRDSNGRYLVKGFVLNTVD